MALTYTITPAGGEAPWTVVDDGTVTTQADAAAYAAGLPNAHFSGAQKPTLLACRMRRFGVHQLSTGAAGSKNFGAWCYDEPSPLFNRRGEVFNVSAGV